MTREKSDLDEERLTAPAPREQLIAKYVIVTMYLFEMQLVYLFCYVSAISGF